MKKFNKVMAIMAIIEYVLAAVNGAWSVFNLMNGKIELGVAQIFVALIALAVAIYYTLEAKDE